MTAMLTATELGTRTFDAIVPGACYRLALPGIETTFEIDRLLWRGHELSGELLVRSKLTGTHAIDDVLCITRINVSSSRARAGVAADIAKAARAPEVPWEPIVSDFCHRILAAERTGEPATELRDIPRTTDAEREIRIFGFRLPVRHGAIIFGDGGAAKSALSLYLGGRLAQDGYRILLADWELSGEDHRERYEAMFGEQMPAGLLYTRCSRPLVHDVDRLTRIVRTQGIDYGIFDSVGFACHEAPETATAALAYFQAIRQLGIGGIHIAHINKSEQGDQRPFGSSFWHNSARATYFMKPTEDPSGLTVGVFNRKMNLGSKIPPFAFQVTFEGGRTTFRQTEIANVDELAPQVPLSQRIRVFLKAGARTRDEIVAAWPDEKPDTIRRTLNRSLKGGYLVQFPNADGIERIGIAARVS